VVFENCLVKTRTKSGYCPSTSVNPCVIDLDLISLLAFEYNLMKAFCGGVYLVLYSSSQCICFPDSYCWKLFAREALYCFLWSYC
jgi:hypothetical protein